MENFAIPIAAFIASLLTFFSGFGLGTLLTPVFAIFFPVDLAVAMTAIVHFLNGLFKFGLVGSYAVGRVIIRFGIPAFVTAILGAWMLARVADFPPLFIYSIGSHTMQVLPIKLLIAFLMIAFALFEWVPRLRNLEFDDRFLPFGGMLSGFFGGLSGHQGALRSAFLARSGLTKEQFIGSGVAIAALIDVARLSVYSSHFAKEGLRANILLISLATLSAFLGAIIGNKLIKKVTMNTLRIIISIALLLLAVALGTGIV